MRKRIPTTYHYRKYRNTVLGDFVDADGYFGYQCVDLIRDYCKKAYGYTMGKLPHAKLANNISTFPGWMMYSGEEGIKMKPGDIGITGETKTNNSGHLFIIDSVDNEGYVILEQNGKGGGEKIKGNEIRLRRCRRGNPPLLRYFRYVG